MLDIVPSLPFQLLFITAPGGSGGVEDQTDMLGFTTERSKFIGTSTHSTMPPKNDSSINTSR